MAVAAYWVRMSLRHRWRGLIGISVLLGLVGGLSLLTLAGARRTQSAYPRFLRSTNPSTMAVIVGGLTPEGLALLESVAQLPQVAEARAYVSFDMALMVDNRPDMSRSFEALGSRDGRYFVQDRFTPTSGRLPDPSNADEIAVNEETARRYGLRVGDQLDLGTFSDAQMRAPDFLDHPTPPGLRTTETIVGVGLFVEGVVQDDTDRSPLILFTPAFVAQATELQTYAWQGLVLRGGDADIDAVKSAFRSMTGPGFPQIARVTSIDTFHAQQAIRPVSISLAAFGAIAALAALLLVGQAIGRHLQAEREHRTVARALGASPGATALAASIGPALAVVAGVVLAVIIAVVASPTMPIGAVRRIEVGRGVDVDWTVLGLGSLIMIISLFAVTVLIASREAPHRVLRRSLRHRRPSGNRATGAGNLPVPVVTGLRLAFERGSGATAVPVRSVIGGAVIAVAVLVAAITFGASLANLVHQPRLFGWDWDLAIVDQDGYGNTRPGPTADILGNDPDIQAWGGAFFGSDQIDRQNLPLLGMDVDSTVRPPIREGRMIENDTEIVLGTATITQLHKRIGDTVQTRGGRTLRIVGTATLPTIGPMHGDHTSLGIGGLVESKQVPGSDRNITGTGEYGPNVIFVRFRSGADKAAVTARVEAAADQIADYPTAADVLPVQRPAEIVNSNDIGSSPTLLGLAVALSAMSTLALALTAAVRRRQRDLALMKALGFTRRQLSATVAYQATGTVLVGLVFGVPFGVVLGRVLWAQFARQLDVLAEPAVPFGAIAIVVVAALVVANVLSALPARFARNVPASLVLRTD
jgi:predicted lysophospholipase L1 biosynthesis ABC-type transport system permease subunit